MTYLSRFASRIRLLEARRARENRLEIVKALSHGQITKRDLFKWGIYTSAGLLAAKNGLSPFARSAYASVPTGAPPSPTATKFRYPMPRQSLQRPVPLSPIQEFDPVTGQLETDYKFTDPIDGHELPGIPRAKRTSHHTHYNYWRAQGNATELAKYTNPVTGVGPIEGRPPVHPDGDFFAHQRWGEFAAKVGYIMSIGQVSANSRFHGDLPSQYSNTAWCFDHRYGDDYALRCIPSSGSDPGRNPGYYGWQIGKLTPPLIRMRYGEPVIMRIHNDMPVERELNGGFGRNEISIHNHNAHNGAESDGASNAYHFPGTFYDYHWSAALARRDYASYASPMDSEFNPTDLRASTPNGSGGREGVPGDFREIQSTLWFHDHRFFFTAENVHKGMFGMINMYSGPDRGNESIVDGVNLRLPSGRNEDWGNLDYDVNLAISNPAFDADGQLIFDIFDTDGYLGDVLAVNGAYYPYMDVNARRYRFRILNASMSRFIKLALVDQTGRPMPFHCIANDGNLLPRPVNILNGILDTQGVAERFDIVVDFGLLKSRYGAQKLYLVNTMLQFDGRKPEGAVSLSQAMAGVSIDPAVGKILEFRVGSTVLDQSVNLATSPSLFLTKQVPIQAPVRRRTFEFVRGGADARDTPDGQCVPECGNIESFPWTIQVDGQAAHSLNASRISALIPRPGDVEVWTLKNPSGGWDHPIHLHFEEAITLDRAGTAMHPTERLARKDVWRLGKNGTVNIQVRFGEFGGAYVSHCHNTVHEDFAMLMRVQLLKDAGATDPQRLITPTPIPTNTADGVIWKVTEVLPEGDPRTTISASTTVPLGGTP